MMVDVMLLAMVGLAISFLSGAESAPCAPRTVSMDVISPADIQNVTNVLACTGEGSFNITWYHSVIITHGIEVSNNKNVTVNGDGFPSIRGGLVDDNEADAILPAKNDTRSGLFSVSNGSTLRLNGLVLEGGNSANGGAVDVFSSSSLFVFDCIFADNNATNGGAISASSSTIYVAGNNVFRNNSAVNGGAIHLDGNSSMEFDGINALIFNHAKGNGGAIYLYDNSIMKIDGNTSFMNNTAEEHGGALDAHNNVSIGINGGTIFNNNVAKEKGGVLYALMSCSINVAGDSIFDNNFAGSDGGVAYLHDSTSMDINGSTSFLNNMSEDDGGAIFLSYSSYLQISGSTSFLDNVAEDDGGAILASDDASVVFNGLVSFTGNSANDGNGGALNAKGSSHFDFAANSGFDNNYAKTDGGAIFLTEASSIQVNGNISFVNNRADDSGGAIGLVFDAPINISGNASFVNNYAKEAGGAVFAYWVSSIHLAGNSSFDKNFGGVDGGAIYMSRSSLLLTMGITSFLNNMAKDDGGAIAAAELCSIHCAGENIFFNNSALDSGGSLSLILGSSAKLEGNTVFDNNSARNSGGAMYATQSEIYTNGITSVMHNSANSPGGGAVYSTRSNVSVDGLAYIGHNTGYDGGAILAQASDIRVTGNVTFEYNEANRDGGAIKTTDSSITIATTTQDAQLPSTNISAQGFMETIYFIRNTAFDYGGAISFANADQLSMSDVMFVSDTMFTLNEAESGGAVGLASKGSASAEFQRCRFQKNKGTRGGALYLDGEGRRTLRDSSFWLNVADESGGAVFNTGALDVKHTVFSENTATDGGLAIQNIDYDVVLWNVTFEGNMLGCRSQTYSYTRDAPAGSCRFELACSECVPDVCESELGNVTIDRETLPTCEPIPEGVKIPAAAITLQTFDLEKGYFRTSTNSPIVLACYQKDACLGGIDPSHYCADGYTGPYCAVCSKGYAPGPSRRCHKCSTENRRFAVGFSTTLLLLVLLVTVLVISYLVRMVRDGVDQAQNMSRHWWQAKLSLIRNCFVKAIPLSAIRIVVVVMQIIIQFTELAGTVFPDEYKSFLASMALVNFDLSSILSSSCLVSTDFYGKLVLTTVAPMVIILACCVTFLIAKARNGESITAGSLVRHRHVSVVLFMIFFVYSSVSFTIFQTFVCDALDDDKAYLRADYSITCHTNRHEAYKLYAGLMVCVYPVGIPAFFAFWLVRHRRELGNPDRESVSLLMPYRSIWSSYKPSCHYYEIVECARRIVLTGAAVFILPDTAEQVAIVLFLAVVFMFISESLSPFKSKSDMWLYRWGNGVILASMYVAFLLKIDFAVEGSDTTSAITALLIAAHAFMIFTVAVQAFVLIRGFCSSKVRGKENPSSDRHVEADGFGIELEAPMNI